MRRAREKKRQHDYIAPFIRDLFTSFAPFHFAGLLDGGRIDWLEGRIVMIVRVLGLLGVKILVSFAPSGRKGGIGCELKRHLFGWLGC